MEFNNGNERRKLNKKWERLRVQYQQAGMSEDAIQAMYDFDLGVLNSERSYVANTLAIVDDGDDNTGRKSSDFKQYEKAITVTDTYHETRTRFAWVGEIKDKRLQTFAAKLEVPARRHLLRPIRKHKYRLGTARRPPCGHHSE